MPLALKGDEETRAIARVPKPISHQRGEAPWPSPYLSLCVLLGPLRGCRHLEEEVPRLWLPISPDGGGRLHGRRDRARPSGPHSRTPEPVVGFAHRAQYQCGHSWQPLAPEPCGGGALGGVLSQAIRGGYAVVPIAAKPAFR